MGKIGWMTVREAVDQLQNGIETEHFKARVKYPYGFDEDYQARIEMIKPMEESSIYEYGHKASSEIYRQMEDEADTLRDKIDNLVFAIGCYTDNREQYRRRLA